MRENDEAADLKAWDDLANTLKDTALGIKMGGRANLVLMAAINHDESITFAMVGKASPEQIKNLLIRIREVSANQVLREAHASGPLN